MFERTVPPLQSLNRSCLNASIVPRDRRVLSNVLHEYSTGCTLARDRIVSLIVDETDSAASLSDGPRLDLGE